VERTDQFAPALSEALSQDTSSLLELRVDPEAITTRTSLSAIREKALQQNKGQ
jgi:acetolactate synthase-1/2/3 large subunit